MLRGDLYNSWAREDAWGIEVLKDLFKGTVIQINSIDFSRINETSVDVDYVVVYKPDTVNEDTSAESFNQLMSLIIGDILTEAIKLSQEDEQNRTNDTSQSS